MSQNSSALDRMEQLKSEMETLRSEAITELESKRSALLEEISKLDAEIAELGGTTSSKSPSSGRTRRRSLTDDEITEKVRILMGDGKALSGKEIQDQIGITFSRFKSWTASHPILVNKGTGKSNSRYVLTARK